MGRGGRVEKRTHTHEREAGDPHHTQTKISPRAATTTYAVTVKPGSTYALVYNSYTIPDRYAKFRGGGAWERKAAGGRGRETKKMG